MIRQRAGLLMIHVAITAILFLSLSQFLLLQTLGLNVTGPIVLACTVVALGGGALSGRLHAQWGPGLLILFLAILSFRNADEISPLTESFLNLVLPVVIVALGVRVDVDTLLRCLTVAGVVLVAELAVLGEFTQSRLALAGTNPIWIARMAGLALLAVLFRPPTRYRVVNWTTAASLAVAMWLTGSRGPVAGVWAAIVVFAALRTKSRWRPILVLGTLATTAAASAFLGGTAVPTRSNGDVNTEWRLEAWKQALHLWTSRPLLGYGTAVDSPSIGLVTYPHNAFLELLVQGGAVGLGVFAVLLWLTWRDTRSARVRSLLLAVLVFSAFSGSVWVAYELWLFALMRVNAAETIQAAPPLASATSPGALPPKGRPVPLARVGHYRPHEVKEEFAR